MSMEATEKKTFSLTLKEIAPLVSEIHYEKKEGDIKLYITLQKNAPVHILIDDSSVSCKRLAPLGLLSRKLLSTIEYKPSSNVYIAFLRPEDFASCQATPKAVKNALEELRDCAHQDSSFVILFETKERKRTHCLAWSKKEDLLQKTLALYQGLKKGNWALVSSAQPLMLMKESLQKNL